MPNIQAGSVLNKNHAMSYPELEWLRTMSAPWDEADITPEEWIWQSAAYLNYYEFDKGTIGCKFE